MWNPLASLPASNIGALAPYSPAVQPNPVPVAEPLHPIFGQHGRNMVGALGDPTAFRAAMQGWRGDRPDRPMMDLQALMAGGGDLKQAIGDWRTNTLDPWRQSVMDWRGQRPLRSDF